MCQLLHRIQRDDRSFEPGGVQDARLQARALDAADANRLGLRREICKPKHNAPILPPGERGRLTRFGRFGLDKMMAAATCQARHHMERGIDGMAVERIEIGLRMVG